MLERKYVEELFQNLKTNSNEFFKKVSENVHWIVMGTHPLAGEYFTKENFANHTFIRLGKLLKEGNALLEIKRIFIDKNYAIIEMKGISTALNGKPFDNSYCWIVKFENEIITEVTAYVDSALVQQLINENE
jgi:uncharacterized protein